MKRLPVFDGIEPIEWGGNLETDRMLDKLESKSTRSMFDDDQNKQLR